MSPDFVFAGSASEIDPELVELVSREDRRQREAVILIASESIAPKAVRELMSSNFGNIYAEGYPREGSRWLTEAEVTDFDSELAHYRRYGDPRYYKGVEYADILEALARRRAAKLFAANGVTADDLYVNVQPLSGSPANIATYGALLKAGDTIMGLDLNQGGHLTHGSRISRSGKLYNAVGYAVDPQTEALNYEALEAQALDVKPKLIVAGFTAYPLMVDWKRFRDIADKCGAYLMADIAHISGLVAAGVHPSPIGIADVVTTTTHKSLCGPRGAMILTHRKDLARKIDRSVFPGEQGGPHLNTIAALALALKLAQTDKFKELQQRVVQNASRLSAKLAGYGLRSVAGRSETHLLLLDTKSIRHEGVHLSGDMAARILDLAGIVTNRNTIPGDPSAFSASGIRMGTVWISQLGYQDREIDLLAEAISTVLKACKPFKYLAPGGKERLRAKVDFVAFQRGREIVAKLTGIPRLALASNVLDIKGTAARELLDDALTSDVKSLAHNGQHQPTFIYGPGLAVSGTLKRVYNDHFQLKLADVDTATTVAGWIKMLSDGFVQFDDLYGKLAGPVVVRTASASDDLPEPAITEEAFADDKPYFVGWQERPATEEALPVFDWRDSEVESLRKTALHATHLESGGRMVPFGGWDMPVWYSSVSEEHTAVREAAGLFDVSHMGVLEASGPNAADFLNLVCTNDIHSLEIGRSHYTYFLLPDGSVVDDLLIYRRGLENFMLVVNAANSAKDWAWLNAVNEGRVQIDSRRPWAKVQHQAVLRDLRDPKWGADCLVDIALQGPRSKDILLRLSTDSDLSQRITSLSWAGLTEGQLGGCEAVISRTGYTGERVAYELFVHPKQTPMFWRALLKVGHPLGLKPCGLAARDSTRTEAGLPLYGHELAGPLGLNPADAGFGSYVKLWKPFFIGREAFIAHVKTRTQIIIRFRMNEKGVRRAELGDPILDRRGKVIGTVTSCAIDSNGFLLGQAVVQDGFAEPGTALYVYQLGGGERKLRIPNDIKPGARMPIPDGATVLSRFPSRR